MSQDAPQDGSEKTINSFEDVSMAEDGRQLIISITRVASETSRTRIGTIWSHVFTFFYLCVSSMDGRTGKARRKTPFDASMLDLTKTS